MRFAFIARHRSTYPMPMLCSILQVSCSGFYAWKKRPVSRRRQRTEELKKKIQAVHQASRGLYGSPRVHRELISQGEKVCENTVAKLMKRLKIRSRIKRRFRLRTTDSSHDHPIAPNQLQQNFTATRPDRIWAADITYVPTDQGWLYLAAVMDLCSRKIVGWSMADHLKSQLAGEALTMALARRKPKEGLLHHSDRGVQYACQEYRQLLEQHAIEPSMSRSGNCYDNAPIESFFGTLKNELIHHEHYATQEQAKQSIFEYVEVYYNRKRRHSSLNYQTPEAFEETLQ